MPVLCNSSNSNRSNLLNISLSSEKGCTVLKSVTHYFNPVKNAVEPCLVAKLNRFESNRFEFKVAGAEILCSYCIPCNWQQSSTESMTSAVNNNFSGVTETDEAAANCMGCRGSRVIQHPPCSRTSGSAHHA